MDLDTDNPSTTTNRKLDRDMRTLRTLGVLAVTASAIALLPATSATAADTETTFTLSGGALTLTAAESAALGNTASGDTSVTGQLGTVSVTDARGGVVGWGASAASEDFTHSTANAGSTSTGITYTGGAVTESGTVTIADGTTTALTAAPAAVATATGVNGNNTASWNPTLDVTLPSSALTGAYSATVTTSVA